MEDDWRKAEARSQGVRTQRPVWPRLSSQGKEGEATDEKSGNKAVNLENKRSAEQSGRFDWFRGHRSHWAGLACCDVSRRGACSVQRNLPCRTDGTKWG